MSVFSRTRGTLVSEPASWWELVREDGSQILKTWVKSPHIFERALVLVVFQTKSVLGWGDSRKESSFQLLQGSLYLMVCAPCSQSHFSRCFEDLMLWGWQVLFRIFWKVWTASPELHTHVPLLPCPPLSLTLLSPPPPFFTLSLTHSCLH